VARIRLQCKAIQWLLVRSKIVVDGVNCVTLAAQIGVAPSTTSMPYGALPLPLLEQSRKEGHRSFPVVSAASCSSRLTAEEAQRDAVNSSASDCGCSDSRSWTPCRCTVLSSRIPHCNASDVPEVLLVCAPAGPQSRYSSRLSTAAADIRTLLRIELGRNRQIYEPYFDFAFTALLRPRYRTTGSEPALAESYTSRSWCFPVAVSWFPALKPSGLFRIVLNYGDA